MAKKAQRGLGRGLSALMADVQADEGEAQAATPTTSRGAQLVAIENIAPNPDQPRRTFAKEALEELADSIRSHGIIQPLVVRENPNKSNGYQIVAGERRWRASQLAQLHELPVVVRDYSDDEVLQVAIVENIQRADLNPVEEALGYRQLIDRHGHTQEVLSEALGKSRSHIANTMRLLQLPDSVLEMVADGRLSSGHARALVTSDNPLELARVVVKQGLNVRQTEKLAKGGKPAKSSVAKPVREKDADTRALESDLAANLGMSVSIDHDGENGGRLSVKYRNLDDLDELCRLLSRTN